MALYLKYLNLYSFSPQKSFSYPRLGLHCFALDIPLPSSDNVERFMQWWQDKEVAREKRSESFSIGDRLSSRTPRLPERSVKQDQGGEDDEEEEEEGDEDEDGRDADRKEHAAKRQQELDALLDLSDSGSRLHAISPVPDDLRQVWSK